MKNGRPKKFRSDSGLFLWSYRVNIARCNLCARAKVNGYIKLKIEENFRGKIGRAISNLVAVLVSDLWAMAGKNGTVFSTIGRHLECAIQTELVVELELALIERKQCR